MPEHDINITPPQVEAPTARLRWEYDHRATIHNREHGGKCLAWSLRVRYLVRMEVIATVYANQCPGEERALEIWDVVQPRLGWLAGAEPRFVQP